MEKIEIMEKIERFVKGQMTEAEKLQFNELRRSDAQFDQQCIEFIEFYQQLDAYQQLHSFKSLISHTLNKKQSSQKNILNRSKILQLWASHKQSIAVAASVALIVTMGGMTLTKGLFNKSEKNSSLKPLVEKIKEQDNQYQNLKKQLDQIKDNQRDSKPRVESKFRATGFLFDVTNNYLLTNAHVVKEAPNNLVVENNEGVQYKAVAIYTNIEKDIAVLQIVDTAFTAVPVPPAPFTIKKKGWDLGDQVFTLGYPKQEMVYGEGYVSALNGYLMDSSFFQLGLSAHEGSSGSPVINASGDIIGMIASKEENSQSVVFATKASTILETIEAIKNIPGKENIRFTGTSTLKNLPRNLQIKKMNNYIFMIKGN